MKKTKEVQTVAVNNQEVKPLTAEEKLREKGFDDAEISWLCSTFIVKEKNVKEHKPNKIQTVAEHIYKGGDSKTILSTLKKLYPKTTEKNLVGDIKFVEQILTHVKVLRMQDGKYIQVK
jgi:hypothetical protein